MAVYPHKIAFIRHKKIKTVRFRTMMRQRFSIAVGFENVPGVSRKVFQIITYHSGPRRVSRLKRL